MPTVQDILNLVSGCQSVLDTINTNAQTLITAAAGNDGPNTPTDLSPIQAALTTLGQNMATVANSMTVPVTPVAKKV